MAGCSNKFGKCDEILCDVRFDGGLKSNVRAALVNELVKYLLYERQQIPSTFNEIKIEISKSTQNKFKDRKAKEVVNSGDLLFTKMVEAFEQCPEIDKILLILGGTIVSPKEMYLVNFPPPCPHVEPLAQRASTMCLFRQLIALDPLAQAKPIGPTTLSVLLLAPRCSELAWFVPKPTYKVPIRGKQFVLNFICKQPATFMNNLSMVAEEVEISGVEPLEFSNASGSSCLISPDAVTEGSSRARKSTGCHEGMVTPISNRLDRSMQARSANRSSASCSGCSAGAPSEEFRVPFPVSDITNLHVPNPRLHSTPVLGSDCIWFQAPVTIKGYREKVASASSFGADWL